MSPIVLRFAGAAAVAVAAVAAVLALGAARAEHALAVFLLVLGGLALLALVRAVRAAAPPARASLFEQALRPAAEERGRPPELTRIEIDLAFGLESAAQLHSRVLPLLRALAAARLAARHGVELERRPDEARTLVGDEAWELVRPDRPAPHDLLAPGVPLRQLEAAVDALEQL